MGTETPSPISYTKTILEKDIYEMSDFFGWDLWTLFQSMNIYKIAML